MTYQNREITRKHLDLFEENTCGSLKNFIRESDNPSVWLLFKPFLAISNK